VSPRRTRNGRQRPPLVDRRALRIAGLLPPVADTREIRVMVHSRPLPGAEIGAEGDAASAPRGFSGCGEFPALFPTRAIRSRRRALSASLSGARHGLAPMRKGQLGHLTAVHLRASSLEPPQQSRQCARIAAVGAIGA
jgi:hypothetical protein